MSKYIISIKGEYSSSAQFSVSIDIENEVADLLTAEILGTLHEVMQLKEIPPMSMGMTADEAPSE